MIGRGGYKYPIENHIKCNSKGCPNYYNVLRKDSNGFCVPCNQHKKRKIKDDKR